MKTEILDKNYKELINKFIEISNMKFVKGVNDSYNSIGLTFEHLLKKKSDSLMFPDYNGIEIKCSSRYSRYDYSLFTLAFDGPDFFEMNRLLEKYGEQDKVYSEKKILMCNLYYGRKVLVNNKYYFELSMDQEKIFLNIYDINKRLIDVGAYILFSTLESRVKIKLSKVAFVWGSKKDINGDKYFRYYKLQLAELKSFQTFVDMIKNRDMSITLMGRVSRSGIKEGKQRNKNFAFKLPKNNVEKLFNIIYSNDF